MPTVIDFEYRGNDSATMEQNVKKHNREQLDFELNLRQYKGENCIKAESSWQYPAVKSFRPEVVLSPQREKARMTNYDGIKDRFNDRYDEKNMNLILHTLEKSTTVYRNAEWPTSLRGDRSERMMLSKSKK